MNDEKIKIKTFQRVKCYDCECIGQLKKIGDEVILYPDEVLNIRSMETRKISKKSQEASKMFDRRIKFRLKNDLPDF